MAVRVQETHSFLKQNIAAFNYATHIIRALNHLRMKIIVLGMFLWHKSVPTLDCLALNESKSLLHLKLNLISLPVK